MEADLDRFREEMRQEVYALAHMQKRILGSAVVQGVRSSNTHANDIMKEIVLKPSKLMLTLSILMVPAEIIFSLWIIYYIAKDSSLLITVCFVALLTFISFKTIRQTLFILKEAIIVNGNGITVGGQAYKWNNILDCYFVTYGFGKSVTNSLMIVLVNGEIKEHYISAISVTKVNDAIYHYLQHYRATSAQPS